MISKFIKNKELRLVATSQAVQLLGALGFTKVLTVYLDKEAYGFYALIMSSVTLVSMLPFTALNEGAARYLSVYEEKGILAQRLINIPILYGIIYLIYIAIGAISYPFMYGDWQKLLLTVLVLTFSEILKNTVFKFENNRRNRSFVAYSKTFEYAVKIGVTFLITQWLDLSITKVLLLLILIDISIVVVEYLTRREDYRFASVSASNLRSTAKDLLNFSWPIIIWSVFGWFQNMGNRWIIDFLMNSESVAEFSLMSSISLLPSTAITGIFGAFLLPIIYQKSNNDKHYAWKIIKIVIPLQIALFFILIVGFYWFGADIVILLSSNKYTNAAWMLPYMMFGSCLFALAQVSTYEIFALKATKNLLISTVIPGISSLLIGYFLVKYFGLKGAMMNFILTYSLYFGLTLIVVLKYHRKQI